MHAIAKCQPIQHIILCKKYEFQPENYSIGHQFKITELIIQGPMWF